MNWTTEFPTKWGYHRLRNVVLKNGDKITPPDADFLPTGVRVEREDCFVVHVNDHGNIFGFDGFPFNPSRREEIESAEWWGPLKVYGRLIRMRAIEPPE
jgi:hypothetical protein